MLFTDLNFLVIFIHQYIDVENDTINLTSLTQLMKCTCTKANSSIIFFNIFYISVEKLMLTHSLQFVTQTQQNIESVMLLSRKTKVF